MTRPVLAVMAGLLCALLGMKQSSALHAEARRLRRWCTVLHRLGVLMQGQSLTLPEALCQAADRREAPDETLRAIAEGLQRDPLLSLPEAYGKCSAPCREEAALMRVFTALSRGTLEMRLDALRQGAEEMALLADAAQERAAKDAKLFQTLGWTGGICLTLFLI